VALIVAFSTLCLNVLLNRVYLTLVTDQTLLNLIEAVVDIALQNLVFARFMLHSAVVGLLAQLCLVLFDHLANHNESLFFFFELTSQLIDPHELVLHLVLHLVDALSYSLHFLVDTAL
jgi:hypothetical protein